MEQESHGQLASLARLWSNNIQPHEVIDAVQMTANTANAKQQYSNSIRKYWKSVQHVK